MILNPLIIGGLIAVTNFTAPFFKGHSVVLLVGLFAFVSSCKSKQSLSTVTSDDDKSTLELGLETVDIDTPGPLQSMFSLLYNTPVFSAGGTKITELRYEPKSGLDPIASAVSSMRPDMSEAIQLQDAGKSDITVSASPSSGRSLLRRFHGICVGTTVFALIGVDPESGSNDIWDDRPDYILRQSASMPASYRPDLQGCRERFLELVNINFRDQHNAENSLQTIESLNFIFSVAIPGYGGVEAYNAGSTVVGTAEVIADLATWGAATKFKAGWRALKMSSRMFQATQTGFKVAAIGANTFRLGGLINDVRSRGASVYDIPTAVLLVTETGFVLAKIKAKPGAKIGVRKVDLSTPNTKRIDDVTISPKLPNVSTCLPNCVDVTQAQNVSDIEMRIFAALEDEAGGAIPTNINFNGNRSFDRIGEGAIARAGQNPLAVRLRRQLVVDSANGVHLGPKVIVPNGVMITDVRRSASGDVRIATGKTGELEMLVTRKVKVNGNDEFILEGYTSGHKQHGNCAACHKINGKTGQQRIDSDAKSNGQRDVQKEFDLLKPSSWFYGE